MYARPSAAGDRIALLDPEGDDARARSGPAAGSSRRRALGGEAPTWIVTGTDEVGLAAAAAQLEERALEDRFAIAVEEGGRAGCALPRLLPPPEAP